MIVTPLATPVTTPPATVATVVSALAQVPPGTVEVSVVLAPTQMPEVPLKIPAVGNGLTVKVSTTVAVPHVVVTVYEMRAVPAARPVTTPPPETVAIVLVVLLQAPPVTVATKVSVVPTHTAEEPVTVPAVGNGFTLILSVTNAVPQVLVTE
jgi:hypothetical protein